MATKYQINGIFDVAYPSKLTEQSAQVARKLDDEVYSTDHLSRRTLEGMIRLAADSVGIGKYLELDRVWDSFIQSGFVVKVE